MESLDILAAGVVIDATINAVRFHRELRPASIAETATYGRGVGPNMHSRIESNAMAFGVFALASYLLKSKTPMLIGAIYLGVTELAYQWAENSGV